MNNSTMVPPEVVVAKKIFVTFQSKQNQKVYELFFGNTKLKTWKNKGFLPIFRPVLVVLAVLTVISLN